MNKHINIVGKSRNDLITPTDLGADLMAFKEVIIPAGFMPAGYEFVEGFRLSQLADMMISKLREDGLIPECNCDDQTTNCTPTNSVFTFDPEAILLPVGSYQVIHRINGGATTTNTLEITEDIGYGFSIIRSILLFIEYPNIVTDPITPVAAFNLSPDGLTLTGAALADVVSGDPVTLEFLVSDDPLDVATILFGGNVTLKSCGYKNWG